MYLLKNVESELDAANPWADDMLGRDAVAHKLNTILFTVNQPFVVSIDAPFGGGKTFFIKRWAQQLKADGAHVVYFNAWETDFAHDPLMAFLATLDDNFFKGSPIAKDAEDAKKAGKALLKSMAFNILETATVGIVKAEDWKEAEAAAETLQLKRYEEYKSTQSTIDKFKKTLLTYGQKLREKDKQKRPSIIFIDELDRCRPDYAIELLEVIKHLFNIENYIFVLAVDRKHLVSSIGAVYGASVDGEAYLKKFIEWNYVLPEPDTEDFVEYLYKKFSLSAVMKQGGDAARGSEGLTETMYRLSTLLNLSLRDIERYMTQLNLLIRFFGDQQPIFPMILALLVVLKDKAPQIYFAYCADPENHQLVIDYLAKQPNSAKYFNTENGDWMHIWLIVAAMEDNSTIAAQLKELIEKQNLTAPENRLRDILRRAVGVYDNNRFTFSLRRHIGRYVYEHIEDLTRN